MLVALFAVVYLLAIIVPALTVLIAVQGFDDRSVIEWYVERKRDRQRRIYTSSRRHVTAH